jgi:NAD(P)-dependent dehydrogenase (short-subunit alcohol dehydrogenase family)
MSAELSGKVAIITGGANGIGRATAELFVQEGARVVIADLDATRGTELASSLGPNARFQRTDVSREADIQGVVDFAVSEFGGLHIMFNNAGINDSDAGGLLDNKFENFRQVIDVNLLGVIVGTQRAARHMAQHGGGSIINTSSIGGTRAGFGYLVYRSAKAGVVQFTKCAAVELGHALVRVNAICPGNIPTDMGKYAVADPGMSAATAVRIRSAVNDVRMRRQALKRQGAPIDVAQAAVFLGSDRSQQISGLTMTVDAGTSVADAIPLMPEMLAARAAAIAHSDD